MPFVFGYGSLADGPGVHCRLDGYRRRWNVAMDNSVDIPGYKYFVDPHTGSRPAVYVTFLNIEPATEASLNGVAFEVGDALLDALDERERNYARVDVTELVHEDLGGPVYAFAGRSEALERFARGEREQRAVISREYQAAVLEGFARFGEAALDEFRRTTEEPPCRAIALTRVDLP